ncbi:sigma factor-like helix-turn-helix DNA-binding protein [Nonomuraea sp. CA-143628]|uniref:sigma factor-like helix-turn-helix DNA-binding protein n=1 Tax=Nonomuraea sp. CA-143628 TaxID=3239997 RepID=UPI003D8FCEC2
MRRLALLHALAQLTPKQRTEIVPRYYEDRTEHETAKLMGTSLGTVTSQTHYALSKPRARPPGGGSTKTLREDLHELAAHAPAVDLAHLAIRGARRNRAGRLTLGAAAGRSHIAGGQGAAAAREGGRAGGAGLSAVLPGRVPGDRVAHPDPKRQFAGFERLMQARPVS